MSSFIKLKTTDDQNGTDVDENEIHMPNDDVIIVQPEIKPKTTISSLIHALFDSDTMSDVIFEVNYTDASGFISENDSFRRIPAHRLVLGARSEGKLGDKYFFININPAEHLNINIIL